MSQVARLGRIRRLDLDVERTLDQVEREVRLAQRLPMRRAGGKIRTAFRGEREARLGRPSESLSEGSSWWSSERGGISDDGGHQREGASEGGHHLACGPCMVTLGGPVGEADRLEVGQYRQSAVHLSDPCRASKAFGAHLMMMVIGGRS